MAGTRAPFATLAALAAATSAHGGPNELEAIEAAKKNLRGLTTPGEVSRQTTRNPLRGDSTLPGLSVPMPTPAPVPDKTANPLENASPNPAAKPGDWLLSGLAQIEAEAREKNADDEKISKRRAALFDAATSFAPSANSPSGSVNPLTGYLSQWLSPRDSALFGESANAQSEAPLGDRARIEIGGAAPRDASRDAGAVDPFAVSFDSQGQRAANPYLENPLQSAVVPSTAAVLAERTSRPGETALPSILTPDQPLLPQVVPAPVEQAKATPPAPTTDPLIDDRKYFPQLRRF
jgi:hypothetical protein